MTNTVAVEKPKKIHSMFAIESKTKDLLRKSAAANRRTLSAELEVAVERQAALTLAV